MFVFCTLFTFQGSSLSFSRQLGYNTTPTFYCQHLFLIFFIYFFRVQKAVKKAKTRFGIRFYVMLFCANINYFDMIIFWPG